MPSDRKQITATARRASCERRVVLEQLKSIPCFDCGGVFPFYVMDFDHRDPETKEFELNKNMLRLAWARVLKEIEKCDVVCVCCHRLRHWKGPQKVTARQRLIYQLKDAPCADCGGHFHYSQMDFDHIRDEKLGQVPQMGSQEAIRKEAAKCDVVCANCHRQRTQVLPRGTPKTDPNSVDMTWKYVTRKNPQTLVPRDGFPAFRSWHLLVGTMPDSKVAVIGGVTRSAVTNHRNKMQIQAWSRSCL